MDIEISVTVDDGKYGSESVSVRKRIEISEEEPTTEVSAEELKNSEMTRFLVGRTELYVCNAVQEYSKKVLAKKNKPDDTSDAG